MIVKDQGNPEEKMRGDTEMSEASPMERMLTAVFGEGFDAKSEAEKIRNKMVNKMENAVQRSAEILAENHVQAKDIPLSVCVQAAGNALVRKLESFEMDVKMQEDFPKLRKDDRLTLENARDLLHAINAYERVCMSLQEQDALPGEIRERLERAGKNAREICARNDEKFSQLAIKAYAVSVLYLAAQKFAANEAPALQDAEEVIAARYVKRLIEDLYSGYNVLAAEERIHDIERYNHYKKLPDLPDALRLATMPAEGRKNQELFEKAAEEIDRVLNHTEDFGYSLNYIRSGRTRYSVFRWKTEKIDPESEDPVYNMWAEDIGEYDTAEEAAEAAGKDGEDPAEIEPYDPEEMWAIVDAQGHNPTKMIYPTKTRAAIFLIGLLGEETLPNWTAWERLLDRKNEEEQA